MKFNKVPLMQNISQYIFNVTSLAKLKFSLQMNKFEYILINIALASERIISVDCPKTVFPSPKFNS